MLKESEIKRLIADDATSFKKRKAREGQDYYEGKHDILKMRMFYYNSDGKLVEDTFRSNIKIAHPFFTELSDQLSSFALAFKDTPIYATDNAEGLQEYLDTYFDDDFWAEIGELIGGAYNKGFEYIYAYTNEEGRTAFQCADSLGVVEVRENETDDHSKYIIYHYVDRYGKDKKKITRIQVWSEKEVSYFVQVGNGRVEKDKEAAYNPRPHTIFTDAKDGEKKGYSFGFIPFIRFDYNKKQVSGLRPIKALIDDYDLHACSLSNNLKDFDMPLHVIKGFEGNNLDELQKNLKTKKLIGTPEEGGVEVHTVDIPYQARKEKLDIDEKNIYKFGMGFNSTQIGDGNITNVVIRSRYTLLELKVNKLDSRLKKILREIIKIVIDEINKLHGTDYKVADVKFDFTRQIMTNDTENYQNEKTKAETQGVIINNILNAASRLDDETIVKAICDALEIDYEKIKDRLPDPEEQPSAIEKTIDSIVPDDEEGVEVVEEGE